MTSSFDEPACLGRIGKDEFKMEAQIPRSVHIPERGVRYNCPVGVRTVIHGSLHLGLHDPRLL